MIDETAGPGERSDAPGENAGQTGAAQRVAFCQQCGQELTSVTVRRAGAAVYCEPCLIARLEAVHTAAATSGAGSVPPAGDAGWTPVGATGAPRGAAGATQGSPYPSGAGPSMSGEPSPGLAGLLGLIPGVGAMYNGQYAKGVAHLVIFAVLASLSSNVSGIFQLFVWGWVFYQAFDAYHTAKARRDGTPLPNPFGLNDIGDRMGFGKNWPGSAARPVSTAPPAGGEGTAYQRPPNWQPNWAPNWAGYVPPTNFGAAAPPPPSAATGQAASTAPGTSTASGAWAAPPPEYGPTYTGEPWQGQANGSAGPMNAAYVTPPARRFPVGAAWLIGLGLVFLLSNLNTSWRLGGSWLVAIVLAALGAWLIFRRVETLRSIARLSGEVDGLGPDGGRRLACQVRGPVVLLVLAVLFALQAAGAWTLGQTWPVLFIAYGALLLLERSMGRSAWPVGMGPAAGGAGTAGPVRTTWAGGDEPRKDGR